MLQAEGQEYGQQNGNGGKQIEEESVRDMPTGGWGGSLLLSAYFVGAVVVG